MSYIDRHLLPEECVVFRTKKHVIIFLWPLILTIFLIYTTNYMHSNFILVKLELLPCLIVLLLWGHAALEYLTSEYVVTNKRVILREGFFVRHANEVRLTTISQVNVNQSLLGQFLGYGLVSINTFGAFDAFPLISHPAEFQKYVNQQLDALVK